MNVKLKVRILERFGKQWRFAQQMQMPEDRLSKIIYGRREATKEEKGKMADLLDTSIGYLWE